MLTHRRHIQSQSHQVIDLVLMIGCLYLAHTIRRHLGEEFILRRTVMFREQLLLAAAVIVIGHYSLKVQGFYRRSIGMSPAGVFWTVARGMSVCVLIVLAWLFVLDVRDVNRSTIFMFGALAAVAVWLFDMAWRSLTVMTASRDRNRRVAVLVGTPAENHEIIDLIHDHPEWTLEVRTQLNLGVQSANDLEKLLREEPVDVVVFTSGKSSLNEVETAILACEVEGVEAWLVADFVRTSITRPAIDELMGKPMIVFRSAPEVSWSLLFKRAFDRVGAALLLVLLSPLMLAISVVIKLSSPGPALFRQQRCGLRGRGFVMNKFRTMVSDAEQRRAELMAFNEMDGPVFKIAKDPRVTGIGRFLRRTSLDELPQLVNVLRGEMSLVGPRPLPIHEVKQFKDAWQRRRLSMKPGMTCLWQTAGRNTVGFEEWMRLDLQYIDTWSLWLDFRILLRTIPVVLMGKGAH
ncbi:MAG: sugar transferase [Verrucomicrobia bacterium]|nr:sugar transferase [Verrucomicrobiota bacterium]